MIQFILFGEGFYYSTTYDLTHSLQRLENTEPQFRLIPMHERADERFVWNRHISADLAQKAHLHQYILPIMHGFVSVERCSISGHEFELLLLSRRSVYCAGTRFYRRGLNDQGHSANFIETEQIVQYEHAGQIFLTSFVQTRGSIPLIWSQRPNLRWMPNPILKMTDDQSAAFRRHLGSQKLFYGDTNIVLINLVNQIGKERRLGRELERVAAACNLDRVKYVAFDFHNECKALNWNRLSVLIDELRNDIREFGFFASQLSQVNKGRLQTGYFRTNCMDCLDRTNVVQSLIAKESLTWQLKWLNVLQMNQTLDDFPAFLIRYNHQWADNGDQCSKQYAGTGALKADFTRLGRRTFLGAIRDGINAITRYFHNNFYDGYRQDATDLFLGNFQVDKDNLPTTLETTVLSLNWHGGVMLCAIFAAAMTLLCIFMAVENTMTYATFWLIFLVVLLFIIIANGEEFVNRPKLKFD